MKSKRLMILAAVLMVAMPAAWAGGPSGGGFELTRTTVDGGGMMRADAVDNAVFELASTIGQPDAGILAGGGFELFGGFWFPIVDGDCNADGGVNLFDFAELGDCTGGPGTGLPNPECACFDFDDDDDVDLLDFAGLQTSFSGS